MSSNQELIDEGAEALRDLQAAAEQGRPCEAELKRVNRATAALSARLAEAEALPVVRIAPWTAGDEELS